MKRCNKDARSYSSFNGFRACPECIESAEEHEMDTMVEAPEIVGRCDVVVETPLQFWERVRRDGRYRH